MNRFNALFDLPEMPRCFPVAGSLAEHFLKLACEVVHKLRALLILRHF